MSTNSKILVGNQLARLLFAGFILMECSFVHGQVQSEASTCGPLKPPGQYGPWDYRTDVEKLEIVLRRHFTPAVEALIRGSSAETPGSDIDYTLRAIPNNHRALISMMRLGDKEKTPQPNGSRYTVECWFERALQFQPDDSIVRMIYSTYLGKQGRVDDAKAQLKTATAYAKDSAFTHFNIGLHYFDLKDYEHALVQAHQAMLLGFSRTELRDKLQEVGKWIEPNIAEQGPENRVTTPLPITQ